MTLGSSRATTTRIESGWIETVALMPPVDREVLGCWTGSGNDMDVCVRKGDHALELVDPDLASVGTGDTTFRDALVTLARTALPNI